MTGLLSRGRIVFMRIMRSFSRKTLSSCVSSELHGLLIPKPVIAEGMEPHNLLIPIRVIRIRMM
jgi:hypothetical protein